MLSCSRLVPSGEKSRRQIFLAGEESAPSFKGLAEHVAGKKAPGWLDVAVQNWAEWDRAERACGRGDTN